MNSLIATGAVSALVSVIVKVGVTKSLSAVSSVLRRLGHWATVDHASIAVGEHSSGNDPTFTYQALVVRLAPSRRLRSRREPEPEPIVRLAEHLLTAVGGHNAVEVARVGDGFVAVQSPPGYKGLNGENPHIQLTAYSSGLIVVVLPVPADSDVDSTAPFLGALVTAMTAVTSISGSGAWARAFRRRSAWLFDWQILVTTSIYGEPLGSRQWKSVSFGVYPSPCGRAVSATPAFGFQAQGALKSLPRWTSPRVVTATVVTCWLRNSGYWGLDDLKAALVSEGPPPVSGAVRDSVDERS